MIRGIGKETQNSNDGAIREIKTNESGPNIFSHSSLRQFGPAFFLRNRTAPLRGGRFDKCEGNTICRPSISIPSAWDVGSVEVTWEDVKKGVTFFRWNALYIQKPMTGAGWK